MLKDFSVQLGSYFTLSNAIEIVILTYLCYKLLTWIYGTQAYQVFKGAVFLLILLPVCDWLGFTTLSFLIRSIFTWLFLSIVIIFQPELRSAFERIGNTFSTTYFKNSSKAKRAEEAINVLISCTRNFHETKTGALIVCEAETGLNDIAETGSIINARLNEKLLGAIFYKNAPLHDGAAIVSIYKDQIIAAGCFLPLTQRLDLPAQMGTRHRAGIGISEQSDALTIIVSEETGKVSITNKRDYRYDISLDQLKECLLDQFVAPLLNIDEDNIAVRFVNRLNKLFGSSDGKQS